MKVIEIIWFGEEVIPAPRMSRSLARLAMVSLQNNLFEKRWRYLMKKLIFILLIVMAMLLMTGVAFAEPPESKNFVSPLSGDEEVPVRDTRARGNAIFNLRDGGLKYKLIIANIDNAFAAHIHCGAAGVNGPVGVTLFVEPGASGRFDGVRAQGTITAPDPGNACAWETLDDVLAAMRSGNTYTNVHTNDGIDPPNTGPGDFPGGEIRGQIRVAGPSE
jgi:hypothetical protein